MFGFTHSLLRVPFLVLVIRNVLALTLTIEWKETDLGGSGGWRRLVAFVVGGNGTAEVAGLSGGWSFSEAVAVTAALQKSVLYSCVGKDELISHSDGTFRI